MKFQGGGNLEQGKLKGEFEKPITCKGRLSKTYSPCLKNLYSGTIPSCYKVPLRNLKKGDVGIFLTKVSVDRHQREKSEDTVTSERRPFYVTCLTSGRRSRSQRKKTTCNNKKVGMKEEEEDLLDCSVKKTGRQSTWNRRGRKNITRASS